MDSAARNLISATQGAEWKQTVKTGQACGGWIDTLTGGILQTWGLRYLFMIYYDLRK